MCSMPSQQTRASAEAVSMGRRSFRSAFATGMAVPPCQSVVSMS